jgi:hypothetical protein
VPRRVEGINLVYSCGYAMSLLKNRSAVLLAGVLLTVAACGGASHAAKTPTPSPSPSVSVAATPTPTPAPAALSQPLLIQVENLYQARPQSGLSSADVVYEYQTEGGISRFTGIWFTKPPSAAMVGPVRSARLISLRLLQIYGGALIYSGASNYVLAQASAASGKHYDDPQPPLFRTSTPPPAARYGAPHNLYTNGSDLATFDQSINLSTVSYQLWTRTPIAQLPSGGTAVSSFRVPISAEETPVFTYQPTTGEYQRSEPATPEYPATGVLNDANTSAPWDTPNIVILQAPTIGVAADNENPSGGYTEGLDFGIGPSASGSGQLAVGGQLYSINWTQAATGPPQLTLADGQPAPIAPGQVVFEVVNTGATVS